MPSRRRGPTRGLCSGPLHELSAIVGLGTSNVLDIQRHPDCVASRLERLSRGVPPSSVSRNFVRGTAAWRHPRAGPHASARPSTLQEPDRPRARLAVGVRMMRFTLTTLLVFTVVGSRLASAADRPLGWSEQVNDSATGC